MYQLALSKPFVEAICWRDLADSEGHYMPHGGLCRGDLSPKPAFERLKRFRVALTTRPEAGSSRRRAAAAATAAASAGTADPAGAAKANPAGSQTPAAPPLLPPPRRRRRTPTKAAHRPHRRPGRPAPLEPPMTRGPRPSPNLENPTRSPMADQPTPAPSPWSWNGRNLLAVAILCVLLGALVGWRIFRNRAVLSDDLAVLNADLAPAQDAVDPNAASEPSLARLPNIGPGRAKAIVTYRQRYQREHPGGVAFTGPGDLDNVPGIGPTIAKTIAPWLSFPPAASQPATQPASRPRRGTN